MVSYSSQCHIPFYVSIAKLVTVGKGSFIVAGFLITAKALSLMELDIFFTLIVTFSGKRLLNPQFVNW